VRERGVIALEEAIFRMTGLAAWRLGLSDRGLVRPSYKADLVLFDAQHIADQATYDTPHTYPTGIRRVLVNGQVILHDGERLPVLPGRVLRPAGNSPGGQARSGTEA
jgi:N-acyl-D-aspartate/D-glutamate deacylase